MELLTKEEIKLIAIQCGYTGVLSWRWEEFENKVIGLLGDHLRLIIEVESNGMSSKLHLFVKCMPRFDEYKAQYLNELNFFTKEYVMLSGLFRNFKNKEGTHKWRPNLLFIKEDLFVFEDVSCQGYNMPDQQDYLTYEELRASIETMARFHAQSYIFEEKTSKELDRPYRIWEDYSQYLQEPEKGQSWRDTGMRAVIDYLQVYSKYKSKPNFLKSVMLVVPSLYRQALDLMKPSAEFRNVVVHRDLWTNNIFLRKMSNSQIHALFVDYQTVLYCSPMLDLCSLIYFNTSKSMRTEYTDKFIKYYYETLRRELLAESVDINDIFTEADLTREYEKSLAFGLTQAGLIVPIVAMSKEKMEEIFHDPKSSQHANVVSRSKEFINIATEDDKYRTRITELFDEIIEKFALSEDGIPTLRAGFTGY